MSSVNISDDSENRLKGRRPSLKSTVNMNLTSKKVELVGFMVGGLMRKLGTGV